MNLREYLFHHRLKITAFAHRIEYGPGYVTEIINGTKKPGKKFAKAVEKATNGEVKAEDLLKESESMTKNPKKI